jgi:serine/threonine-protein kinase
MTSVPAPEEFGSYLVYEQLGVGGMATVHVAESKGLRKRVALKRLLAHAAESPELVRSFITEARLVAYLKHTNIAQTYDFGKVGDTYFIAMELVPGPTVGQLIRQCKSTVGVIPFPITLNILCQVCDALAYAHALNDEQGKSLGLVHRDVSPPNIIISNTGTVKLIDFGVAKQAKSQETMVGTVKGKFSYMAPEYLNGQLDSRVDLWALGAVAHELLTNRTLFEAPDDLGVLEKVRRGPIVPPSRFNTDVPRDLDAVVLTALERNPAHRWQAASAMRTALANVASEVKNAVTNAQMIQWIEWAFTQTPGGTGDRDGVSQLIELLERPSDQGVRSIKAASSATRKLDVGEPAGRERSSRRSDIDDSGQRVRDDETTNVPGRPRLSGDTNPARSLPEKKARFSIPRVGAAMVKRRAGRSIALWFALLVVAATVGLAAYFFQTEIAQSF